MKLVLRGPKAKLMGHVVVHIHNVTCAKYATNKDTTAQYATVQDGLSDVQHRTSVSTIDVPLAKRTTGTYALNVHWPSVPYDTAACAHIPKRG